MDFRLCKLRIKTKVKKKCCNIKSDLPTIRTKLAS